MTELYIGRGLSMTETARRLGVNVSTVSRDVTYLLASCTEDDWRLLAERDAAARRFEAALRRLDVLDAQVRERLDGLLNEDD